MFVGSGFVLLFDRGNLGTQAFEFSIQRRFARQQFAKPGVFLCQLRFQKLQLCQSLRRDARGLRQQQGIEGQPISWFLRLGICSRQPEADMEQLAHRRHRVELLQGLMAVRGQIAQVFNQLGLDEYFLANRRLESRLVDERAEIVLVGQLERGVALVEPRHGQLQRAAAVETSCSRVGDDQTFSPLTVGEELRPLGMKKAKIAGLFCGHHTSPRKARCWSTAKRESSLVNEARCADFNLSIAALRLANSRCNSMGGIGMGMALIRPMFRPAIIAPLAV